MIWLKVLVSSFSGQRNCRFSSKWNLLLLFNESLCRNLSVEDLETTSFFSGNIGQAASIFFENTESLYVKLDQRRPDKFVHEIEDYPMFGNHFCSLTDLQSTFV
ncbi:hypothetical protein L596_023650 [Steinernema carpocapsae]|uniref:Uncharacterized protein n=1 Tax=Steinernema carpocapsae TaxID=34508 RepID=A0A4U5MEH8_STECR|nr:hypothetical protein L596_023650 [Steinernema carpocapsae]